VLLFSREGDRLTGSGRTFGRTPLFSRVAPVAARFASEFGGHDAALGMTLAAGAWEPFRDALRSAFTAARDDAEWESTAVADTELSGPEVTAELAAALSRFEPHGAGNPSPLFLLRALEWDGSGRRIGPRGLRTCFTDGERRLEAVGWTLGELPETSRPQRADVAAHVTLDAVTGRPTLEVVDIGTAVE
jgi:single-stranded-DNA-specific exonuclease